MEEDLRAVLKELAGIRTALEKIVQFLNRPVLPADLTIFEDLDEEDEYDELYDDAKKVVLQEGKASTSYLQRKLGIGYARAAKLIDMLEINGVVGPSRGAQPRRVIRKLSPEVIATLQNIEKQLKKKKKK